MGFGHRVYRAEDPRARVLRRTAQELGAPRFEVAEALEKAALERAAGPPARPGARDQRRVLVGDRARLRRGAGAHVHLDVHLRPARPAGARTSSSRSDRAAGPPVGTLRRPGSAQARRRRGLGPGRRWRRAATPGRLTRHRPAYPWPGERRPTDPVIPADLQPADGRFGSGPCKVRPEAVAALAAAGAGLPRHVAPAGDGAQRRSRRVRAGLRDAVRAARRATRSCSATAAPTAFWDVASFGLIRDRAQYLSFGEFGVEVRRRCEGRAVPRRPDGHQVRARARAALSRRGRRRRVRDRRTTRPRPACRAGRAGGGRRRRRAAAASTRRPAPAGWPVDVARDRRLLLRAAEVLRLRRRAVARADVAGRAGAGRADQGERPLHPGVPRPADRDRQLAGWTRRTTPRRWPRSSCSPSRSTGSTRRAGCAWAAARTADSRGSGSTAGPRSRRSRRRSSTDPAQRSQVVGTIDFDDASTPRDREGAARQRHRRHRAVPQARPQPAADRDVPGDRPGRRRGADRAASTGWSASSEPRPRMWTLAGLATRPRRRARCRRGHGSGTGDRPGTQRSVG